MSGSRQPQLTGEFKKVISFLLVVVLAAALAVPLGISSAYAAPTSAEKQAEADEASAALVAAEAEMEQVRNDYLTAGSEYEAARAAMEEAQVRIDAAQGVIADTQTKLGVRAKQMYRDGRLSFIEMIFGATSFRAFTTSWDLLNQINKENAELIQTNKDARAEAVAAHEEYALQEQTAADRLADAEYAKDRAEALVSEQQALVNALDAEVKALLDEEQAARVAAMEEALANERNNRPNPSDDTSPANPVEDDEPTPSNPSVPVPSEGYSSVVAAAQSRLGYPYAPPYVGPDAFDCSGFTSWCYRQAGLGEIGRDTWAQYANASARWDYTAGSAAPGDVLWFKNLTHVAIYIGNGYYIDAAYPGVGVRTSNWAIEDTVVLRF